MSDLIKRQDAIEACRSVADNINSPTNQQIGAEYCLDLIKEIPSAEPERITIEEVANLLGSSTIQSALYWFEFLKTLDLLGFAIIRKETR
jgi:hypothetical protein